jgi:hypothetical protein
MANMQRRQERLKLLDNDLAQISEKLNEENINAQYASCWQDIDMWEENEIGLIKETANLMRQEIIDVVGERLYRPRQDLSMLTTEINKARERMEAFNENDLERWKRVLDRVKKLAEFTITLSNTDDGLELTLSGENVEDAFSSENTNRQVSGDIPISSPQLQRMDHIQDTPETIPATENNSSSTNNMQSNQTQVSATSANIGSIQRVGAVERETRERPTTTLIRRRAAAEIPFDRRSFFHLRWRFNASN